MGASPRIVRNPSSATWAARAAVARIRNYSLTGGATDLIVLDALGKLYAHGHKITAEGGQR
jgi:hypothetical protein